MPEPVKTAESWPNLKRRFERGAQRTEEQKKEDPIAKERQEYWKGRLEEIAEQKKQREEVKVE